MTYRVRIWHGDKTTVPIIDHRTKSLSEAKYSFNHWIAEYYRTFEDYTRFILVTNDDDIPLAYCTMYPSGRTGWRYEKWAE